MIENSLSYVARCNFCTISLIVFWFSSEFSFRLSEFLFLLLLYWDLMKLITWSCSCLDGELLMKKFERLLVISLMQFNLFLEIITSVYCDAFCYVIEGCMKLLAWLLKLQLSLFHTELLSNPERGSCQYEARWLFAISNPCQVRQHYVWWQWYRLLLS